ncbi:MAG TPA: GNAT family N-acetyltransferase [Vicinamibacterales bacterium]|nr:GNAT family N-acetyltransferase [Vicinamibacterales bacterium]
MSPMSVVAGRDFSLRRQTATRPADVTIRTFLEHDIPAVAALFARAYPHYAWASQAACESYFREMFFDNPWRDPDLPSRVAEEGGRISGFYGVIPRRMRLHGRQIRVAVTGQFMVDPDRRHSFTAVQLCKACLAGPQDLTLADGASEQSRRLWLAIGGSAALLYSLQWTRPVRPARHLLSYVEQRKPAARWLLLPARPVATAIDGVASRLRPNRFSLDDAAVKEAVLDPATMAANLPEVLHGVMLQPVYDVESLVWLLEQARRKVRHGTLRAHAVFNHDQLIGWYLYYAKRGDVGEVVQLAATAGAFDVVLQRLLADAWGFGATAVRGRIDPRYLDELSNRHCWFGREGTWTLFHSRHPDVVAAIQQGEAFLSRLEGEWWLRWTDAVQ